MINIEREYDRQGNLKEEFTVLDGVKNGESRSFYDNGKVSCKTTYLNGLEDGIHQEWHQNGELFTEGLYRKGLREGTHLFWKSNGEILGIHSYINGEMHGVSTNFIDGNEVNEYYWHGRRKHFSVETIELMASFLRNHGYTVEIPKFKGPESKI